MVALRHISMFITERYRLQCDDFASMWLMLSELVNRLSNHFRVGRGTDFSISYDGALPLTEYFDVLDAHFDVSLIFKFPFYLL